MEEVTSESRYVRHRSVQSWLRDQTADAHSAAERAVMRALSPLGEASYGAYLQSVHRLFAALEAPLWAACSALVPDAAARGKAPWLREDLAALELPETLEPEVVLPAWREPLEALGAAYVLEGSTLGGPVLLGRVRAAGALPNGGDRGARFLTGYGSRNAAMWQAFRGALQAAGEGAADWAALRSGALAMFRAYEAAVTGASAR